MAGHKKRINSICLDFIEDHQGICYFMKLANIDALDKAKKEDDPYQLHRSEIKKKMIDAEPPTGCSLKICKRTNPTSLLDLFQRSICGKNQEGFIKRGLLEQIEDLVCAHEALLEIELRELWLAISS